jgi:Tripartite tricarboxylate transporter TctB family
MTGSRARPSGEWAIALGTVALALIAFWQAASIPVSPLYAKVGPTVFPYMTAGGLLLLGIALCVAAARGGWQPEEEKEFEPDKLALGWMLAGLALNILLIGPLGFTLASIVLFVCVARAFGSADPVRDACIAAVFALIAYFGFAKVLGINIGGGVIEGVIEQVLPKGKA